MAIAVAIKVETRVKKNTRHPRISVIKIEEILPVVSNYFTAAKDLVE